MGAVAYRLQLPEEAKVHPVFHVSQLKRARQQLTQVMPPLPDMDSMLQVPSSVQEYRWLKEANKMSRQGLVRCTNTDPSATTWENLEDLHRRFPEALAWKPEEALEYRWSNHKAKPRQQVRVAWNYTTPDKATWEDLEAMKRKFLVTSAWGQAENQGEGIVSSTPASATDDGPRNCTRPPRTRAANPRVTRPDWVGPHPAQRRKPRAQPFPTSGTRDE